MKFSIHTKAGLSYLLSPLALILTCFSSAFLPIAIIIASGQTIQELEGRRDKDHTLLHYLWNDDAVLLTGSLSVSSEGKPELFPG